MSSIIIEDEKFLKDGVSLFPHQVSAIEWMNDREDTSLFGIKGGILCMQMGMGKSLTSVCHTLSKDFRDNSRSPTLIVASKTVMIEWKTQCIEKFLNNCVNVLYLHRDFYKDIDNITASEIMKYDLVITTYDVCTAGAALPNGKAVYEECFVYGNEHTMMKGKVEMIEMRKSTATTSALCGSGAIYAVEWERIIADESQRFANPQTVTYYCMMAIVAKYRWCLSGTPIRNYETDIWAQLRFCGYTNITRASYWKRIGKAQFVKDKLGEAVYIADYKDVGIELPEKKELQFTVKMDNEQAALYNSIKERTNEVYKQVIKGSTEFTNVLAMLTKLRQCAISTTLLNSDAKRGSTERNITDFKSPKVDKIVEIIKSIPKEEKICIFTSFTTFSDLIAAAISKLLPEIGYVQVDGDKDGHDRKEALEKFKTDVNCRVILLTYRVGGEGLNLVEANHCIFGEPWWSTAVLKQAKARVWRTGQTRPVSVYTVVVENTVEEMIVNICVEKEKMISEYLLHSDKCLDKVTVGRLLNVYN